MIGLNHTFQAFRRLGSIKDDSYRRVKSSTNNPILACLVSYFN